MKTIEQLTEENATLRAQIAKANTDLATMRKELTKFRAQYEVRRLASNKFNLKPGAIDALDDFAAESFEIDDSGKLATRESAVSRIPGLGVETWLGDLIGSRQYMLSEKDEGSRRGVRNPFSADSWDPDAQGALVRQDRAKAERLASEAGVKIGQPRPAAKAAV